MEKIITPHTSYEELVAQQSGEIEEIMKNEVQRFYMTWNKKLEELKERNNKLRDGEEVDGDHHEVFEEDEKQALSDDDDVQEMNEMSDDDVKKSSFGSSKI